MKLIIFILTLIFTCDQNVFSQKPNAYLLAAIQFDDAKHFGARINFGLSSFKAKGKGGFGLGMGLEAIGYNDNKTGFHSTAFPLYVDGRYYLPLPFYLFIEGNAGVYNQSTKNSTTISYGNGGYLKNDINIKGQEYLGANIGFILPLKTLNKGQGPTLTIGYRHVSYNTIIKTEERKRINNGYQTIKRTKSESSGNGWINIAIGFSIL